MHKPVRSDSDLRVHAARQLKLSKVIDRLLSGPYDFDQSFMNANFKLLPRFFIDMRRTVNTYTMYSDRERNGSADLGSRTPCGLDYLPGRFVQERVIVGLQANPYLMLGFYHFVSPYTALLDFLVKSMPLQKRIVFFKLETSRAVAPVFGRRIT